MMSFPIYIASFGYQAIIQKILDHFGISDKIAEVLTPSMFGSEDGTDELGDKNVMLQYIMETRGYKSLLLVDDTQLNIDQALSQLQVAGMRVASSEAFTVQNVVDLQQRLVNEHIDCIVFDADMTFFKQHVTSEFIYDLEEDILGYSDNDDFSKVVDAFDPRVVNLAEGIKKLFFENVLFQTNTSEDVL